MYRDYISNVVSSKINSFAINLLTDFWVKSSNLGLHKSTLDYMVVFIENISLKVGSLLSY